PNAAARSTVEELDVPIGSESTSTGSTTAKPVTQEKLSKSKKDEATGGERAARTSPALKAQATKQDDDLTPAAAEAIELAPGDNPSELPPVVAPAAKQS